jgi:hypothetical protein
LIQFKKIADLNFVPVLSVFSKTDKTGPVYEALPIFQAILRTGCRQSFLSYSGRTMPPVRILYTRAGETLYCIHYLFGSESKQSTQHCSLGQHCRVMGRRTVSLLLLVSALLSSSAAVRSAHGGECQHLTGGFTAVEAQFKVQKPYDVPLAERYEVVDGARAPDVGVRHRQAHHLRPPRRPPHIDQDPGCHRRRRRRLISCCFHRNL